jgi:hypothetical protein
MNFREQGAHARRICFPFSQTIDRLLKLPVGDLVAELLAAGEVQVDRDHGLLRLEVDLPKLAVFLQDGHRLCGPADVLAQDDAVAAQLLDECVQPKGKFGECGDLVGEAFLEAIDHADVGLAVDVEFELGVGLAHIALIANHFHEQRVDALDHLKAKDVVAAHDLGHRLIRIIFLHALRVERGIFREEGRYEVGPKFHFCGPSEAASIFALGNAGSNPLVCGTVSKFGFSWENV